MGHLSTAIACGAIVATAGQAQTCAPALLGRFDQVGPIYQDIAVAHPWAFVAGGDDVFVFNVSDPAAPTPTPVASLATPGQAVGLDIAAGALYVADLLGGITIFDTGDPSIGRPPERLGEFRDLPDVALAVDVHDGLAYLACGEGGLQIVDVSDPGSPVLVGGIDLLSFTSDVAVVGDRAYVANWDLGVMILDVSEPTEPKVLLAAAGGGASRLAVHNGLTYLLSLSGRLEIWDLSDPAHPTAVGVTSIGRPGRGIALRGNHAYVTSGTIAFGDVLHVLDVSDPTAIQRIGFYQSALHGEAFAVCDDVGYLVLGPTDLLNLSSLRTIDLRTCGSCYSDCDASGDLDFFDFLCFQDAFGSGSTYADCDCSGSLDFFDFLCFQGEFGAGC